MNADEIVRALREMATYDCGYEEESDAAMAAIDLIESLQAQLAAKAEEAEMWHTLRADADRIREGLMDKEVRLIAENIRLEAQFAESQRRAQDARNELCQKCGRYREAHKGACDGCRWTA